MDTALPWPHVRQQLARPPLPSTPLTLAREQAREPVTCSHCFCCSWSLSKVLSEFLVWALCAHLWSLQSCLTLCDPRLLCPWDSPDNSTGVGWHALLQGSSQPRDWTHVSYVSHIGRRVLDPSTTWQLSDFQSISIGWRRPRTLVSNKSRGSLPHWVHPKRKKRTQLP